MLQFHPCFQGIEWRGLKAHSPKGQQVAEESSRNSTFCHHTQRYSGEEAANPVLFQKSEGSLHQAPMTEETAQTRWSSLFVVGKPSSRQVPVVIRSYFDLVPA